MYKGGVGNLFCSEISSSFTYQNTCGVWDVFMFPWEKSQAEIAGLITGEGNSTLVGVVINLITDLIPKLCTSNIHITIQYTLHILEYTYSKLNVIYSVKY